MFATMLTNVGFLLLSFGIIGIIRNCVVHNIRKKAIDVVFIQNTITITNALETVTDYSTWDDIRANNNNNWKVIDHQSYNEMMFELTKWTFKQFYPQLTETESK